MANFLNKEMNEFNTILLVKDFSLLANNIIIDDIVSKIHLNKLFEYSIREYKIMDKITIEVFKNSGIKSKINNQIVYYLGDLNQLFFLKDE
jgi:hypothetical protein